MKLTRSKITSVPSQKQTWAKVSFRSKQKTYVYHILSQAKFPDGKATKIERDERNFDCLAPNGAPKACFAKKGVAR